MSIDITVTDLFCGAGGSSIGAEAAGARLRMAANHWRLAIETHNSNFPDADHDCADVSQVNPRRYPRTDILIASPECTNHSSAKTSRARATIWDPNADAAEERSRATMWDVPRFAEHHRYELVIVENVVEARSWAPFDAWLGAMHALGYEHRALYLNSMVAHPTPQSRDRLYVVFWKRGNTPPDLEFRPVAFCPEHGDVGAVQSWKNPLRPFGKYRAQYVYRCPACGAIALPYVWPAAAAIDWSLPVLRIGDRTRPLAEATLRRIRVGLDRYGPAAIVQAAGHTYERAGYYRTWPTWMPLGTQTTTTQHALVVETGYTGGGPHDMGRARSIDEPFRVQTARQTQALVVPLRTGGHALDPDAEPLRTAVAGNQGQALVVHLRGTEDGQIANAAQPADEPVRTISAGGRHAGLIRNYQGGSEDVQARPGHHSLLVPYYSTGVAYPAGEPAHTVTALDRSALVDTAIDVEDCGFRMLEPHEIGRAMAFADDYIVLGNKRERVRQYGNAVTPPTMAAILARGIASLSGNEGRA